MTILMEQHQRWAEAHDRLWPKYVPEALPQRPPNIWPLAAAPATFGAPFNFYLCPSYRSIVKLMALKHNLTVDDLLGPRRTQAIVNVRHETIGTIFEHCGLSLTQIGRLFHRDHTTIIHSLARFSANHPASIVASRYRKTKRFRRLKLAASA